MAELLRVHDKAGDKAGDVAGDEAESPVPPDQPRRPDAHADTGDQLPGSGGRPLLSALYQDDPDDIFTPADADPERDACGVGEPDGTDPNGSADDGDEALAGPPDRPDETPLRVDRPALPPDTAVRYGVDYTRRDGHLIRPELFDGPPTREQARQGSLGDCGLIAALGAVAGHRPEAIEDLILPRPEGSFLVRLHDVRPTGRGAWEPTGRRIELAVTPDLPVLEAFPHRAAFANTYRTGVSWAAILEKALAGVDADWSSERTGATGHIGYDRLDQGTFPVDRAELLALLTGRPAAVHPIDTAPGRERAVEHWLTNRLDSRSPVLVSTGPGGRYGQSSPDLVPSHAYEVVGIENGTIALHNPWGRDHPPPLGVREFLDNIVPLVATVQRADEEDP